MKNLILPNWHSALHPQTNGKAERLIRFLVNSLSLLYKEDQTDWDDAFYCCLFAYTTTLQRIIQETPFFLLNGREVVLPGYIMFGLPLNDNEH